MHLGLGVRRMCWYICESFYAGIFECPCSNISRSVRNKLFWLWMRGWLSAHWLNAFLFITCHWSTLWWHSSWEKQQFSIEIMKWLIVLRSAPWVLFSPDLSFWEIGCYYLIKIVEKVIMYITYVPVSSDFSCVPTQKLTLDMENLWVAIYSLRDSS